MGGGGREACAAGFKAGVGREKARVLALAGTRQQTAVSREETSGSTQETDRKNYRQKKLQTDRQIDRQADRQTDRQTDLLDPHGGARLRHDEETPADDHHLCEVATFVFSCFCVARVTRVLVFVSRGSFAFLCFSVVRVMSIFV